MSELDLTLAEAIVAETHLSRLGYPNKWDLALLLLAREKIEEAVNAVRARHRNILLNTPESDLVRLARPGT